MKKYRLLLALVFFVLLSNYPPLNFFMRLMGGDSIKTVASDNLYVTADLNSIHQGPLSDSLKNVCYNQYRATYKSADNTLYRIQKIELWKFWNWVDYLSEEKWKQPYKNVSSDELKLAMSRFSKTYATIDGTYNGCYSKTSYRSSLAD
jgi:hypothetical protein